MGLLHNQTSRVRAIFCVFFAIISISLINCLSAQTPNPLKGKRVLVFSKTAGFRHASIPDGKKALQGMGKQYEFEVDTTENAAKFTEDNLKQYRLVVFLSTTGNVLNPAQQVAFERFIQAGGGFIGIHAASDTEYDWAWYAKLVGGYFASHPGNPNVQEGKMIVVNKNHPSTSFMDDEFIRKDEFYDFKNFDPSVNVLVRVDEKSYKEGKMGDFHPMAWFKEYDGGRTFYTNWGHTNETFTEPLFLKHLWGGMTWAASSGDLNYSKVRSQLAPEENRFTRTVLDEKLDEPTELAVTDAGNVFYAERKGKLKYFNQKTNTTKVIAEFDVYTQFEYGLMGVNLDPNFNTNKYVYVFYSPQTGQQDTAQRLARFFFDETKEELVMNSEKILLRVPVKRTDCCHTGGSIDWDKMGNLYLSTGDDVNPFNSDGYAPIDEREGRKGWDGLHTSSNTNDFRGKILRIKPKEDGTYEIPEGNLFPKGTERTRPEIYVMGNRNPYRISVDKHTGFLYWGEVGPDAGENSTKFGPRGHDEVNQARKAGYFGWPLFVGDNKAYAERRFADTNYVGQKFDAEKPLNKSPNNTGIENLPPAQKAFIYYPYNESPEFGEIVGKGGRNAMAGPVYYSSDYQGVTNRFPDYFEGKFFAYDWMRDWVNIVSMKPNGDFESMERFLPNMKFSHPMDMHFGKNGALYMLEYGQNWFAQNDEARLTRIDYQSGNRVPVADIVADKIAGAAPFTVNFSSKNSLDYDGDPLSMEWNFDGKKKSKLPNPSFTFKKAGIYKTVLSVKDGKGNIGKKIIEIRVGNEPPKVELALQGNKTFYWNGDKVKYDVKVTDKEDGSLEKKTIKDEEVSVNIDYLEGFDKTVIAQGHQSNIKVSSGARLIELSDCKSCHQVKEKSVGPTYFEVAKKYKGSWQIEHKLADRIIKGGGGVWGEHAMSAHPQLTKDEAVEMVKYILSLADEVKSKPLNGEFLTDDKGKAGTFIFAANYSDKGNPVVGTQSASQTFTLRSAKFKASTFDDNKETMNFKADGLGDLVIALTDKSHIAFNDIDMTGLDGFSMMAFATDDRTCGGNIEVRLDAPDGILVGSTVIKKGPPMPVRLPFDKKHTGTHKLYLVFTNSDNRGKPLFGLLEITAEKAKLE